jgi:toxin ParE1/3/4
VGHVRLSARAKRDLLDIWLDIGANNESAANRVYDRLQARIRILEKFPEAGMARPDINDDARVLTERPYLILYRVADVSVLIVRVLHGARDIDSMLFDEGLA